MAVRCSAVQAVANLPYRIRRAAVAIPLISPPRTSQRNRRAKKKANEKCLYNTVPVITWENLDKILKKNESEDFDERGLYIAFCCTEIGQIL